MSRIRTIKPDAFKSESLSAVPRGTRWTFAGLWTYLDDSGRGRADVRLIAAELYPLDDNTSAGDVEEDLDALIDQGCIHTYQSGGKVYIHAPEFLRHQRISHPTKSVLPPCPCEIRDDSGDPPEDSRDTPEDSSLNLPEPSSLKGKGRERKGKGGGTRASSNGTTPTTAKTRPPRTCPKHPHGTDQPCGPCADHRKLADTWQPPTPTPPPHTCEHGNRPNTCQDCAELVANPPPGWRPKLTAS